MNQLAKIRRWGLIGLLYLMLAAMIVLPQVAGVNAWSGDSAINTAICTASDKQDGPVLISDGTGGVIIAWRDQRNSHFGVYAQRVNDNGEVQWATNGAAICPSASGSIYTVSIVSDGTGGAIIAWDDNDNIYAQRVDSNGVVQWAVNGVPICTHSGQQLGPQLTSDGAGGAIITWQDYRGSSYYDIYAQRVDSSGIVQWSTDGIGICTASGGEGDPRIVSDGVGGAIIIWTDWAPYVGGTTGHGNPGIYAQRVNSDGIVLWADNGSAIRTGVDYNAWEQKLISDGSGGAFITWSVNNGNPDYDVYVQRVNSDGIVQWATDGVAICVAPYEEWASAIISDGTGGAIITWPDRRSGSSYNIYTQRVDSNGVVQWVANGMAICTVANESIAYQPVLVSDGNGGAIIVWQDRRSGSNEDIYAQRVDSNGVVQWVANGVPICSNSSDQWDQNIISDESGGAIITWTDKRNDSSDYDIYAQWVNSAGSVGTTPTPTIKEPYKIGAIFSTTGSSSNIGVPEENTIRMIVDKINRAGGINGHNLNVITYDDATLADTAATLATKLIEQDQVLAIIGPTTTGSTLAISSEVAAAKIPLVSCAVGAAITNPVQYWIFKTPQTDKQAVIEIYRYLQEQNISKVAIITSTSGFGSGGKGYLESEAANYNITLIDNQRFDSTDTSMITQLTHIKGTDAQAVVCWDTDKASAVVAQNMQTLYMDIPLYCSHGIATTTFITEAGDAANGVIFPAGKLLIVDNLSDSDPQKTVLTNYENDYDALYSSGTLSNYGGYAYDALYMVVNALKTMPEGLNLSASRAAIRAGLEETTNFVGISGIFTMSPTDHLGMQLDSLALIRITNGTWAQLRINTTPTPDTAAPVVSAFSVTPSTATLGNSFIISFSTTDSGGAGLKQVELWRANDNSGSPGTWVQITNRLVSGNSYSGSFSDTPSSSGSYWYGVHAVDNAINWAHESSPEKVIVTIPTGAMAERIYGIPVDFRFDANLSKGADNSDVRCLQIILNLDSDTRVTASGDGSPGNETTTFGPATEAAVKKFQEKYRDDILTPAGLLSATGTVGPNTILKLNQILDARFSGEYKNTFGLLNEQERKDAIWRCIKDYKSELPEGFPIEVVLAIATQENGDYAHWNNEIVTNDWGRGIMQITTNDFVGAGGVNTAAAVCNDCKNRESELKLACSMYYSNNGTGIEANIKDGLYALSEKYRIAKSLMSPLVDGYTEEELLWLLTVHRYGPTTDDPLSYVHSVGDKLIELADGDYGQFDGFNKETAKSLGEKFKKASTVSIKVHSPVELRVYDNAGNVTGLVDGQVIAEIPNSFYDSESVTIFSPADNYVYELVGTGSGTYNVEVTKATESEPSTISVTNMTVSPRSVYQYTINWNAIAQGGNGVTLQIDSNGDGHFEETQHLSATGESTSGEGTSGKGTPTWVWITIGLMSILSALTIATIYRIRFKPVVQAVKRKK